METSEESSDFEDLGAVFQHSPALESYQAIYRQVLKAYNYRCALTWDQFEPLESGLHPQLRIVAIRAREQGGPLHVSNYLSLSVAGEHAFLHGHLIIGDDYTIIPDHAVLAPSLAKRLHGGGRLLLPADGLYHPDRGHLAFHRKLTLRG